MRYKCVICGSEGYAKAARKYCDVCLPVINRKRGWAWHVKNYQYKGPFSKEIKCADCGAIITVRSQLKVRCAECQRKHNNQLTRESKNRNHPKYMAMKKVHTHKRRGNIRGTHTHKQLLSLAKQQNHCCYYCGDSFFINGTLEYYFEVEHKTPISRGGTNDITNIALACKGCNARKGVQTAEEFLEMIK